MRVCHKYEFVKSLRPLEIGPIVSVKIHRQLNIVSFVLSDILSTEHSVLRCCIFVYVKNLKINKYE